VGEQLGEYLRFLTSLRRADHRFYRHYLLHSGEGWGQPSPYFDGEILLALAKAARYLGYADLVPDTLRSADAMYEAYALRQLAESLDDPDTKGFFPWGCLALVELHALDRADPARHAHRAISLAHWMIDVHRVAGRRRNTAYAQEGILSAYHLARDVGDVDAAGKFRRIIEQELSRLTSWQVGGPLPCPYLQRQTQYDPSCVGGVLGADENPWLRIDTTQHQMHAVILARRYVWTDE
jgi:UDP-N-acetylmuramoyl-tripeptide--D-alanyl-D-alanine ligase